MLDLQAKQMQELFEIESLPVKEKEPTFGGFTIKKLQIFGCSIVPDSTNVFEWPTADMIKNLPSDVSLAELTLGQHGNLVSYA